MMKPSLETFLMAVIAALMAAMVGGISYLIRSKASAEAVGDLDGDLAEHKKTDAENFALLRSDIKDLRICLDNGRAEIMRRIDQLYSRRAESER